MKIIVDLTVLKGGAQAQGSCPGSAREYTVDREQIIHPACDSVYPTRDGVIAKGACEG